MKRYEGEPVDSERRGTHADDLATPTTTTPAPPRTGTLSTPERNRGRSIDDHRPPVGTLLAVAPQDVDLGAESKQSGAGRAFVPVRLSFPEDQSATPEPDRRRIARPMPTAARDNDNVIGGPDA